MMNELFVTFKKPHFLGIKQSKPYERIDFIAICAELLCLFVGISLLILVVSLNLFIFILFILTSDLFVHCASKNELIE